MKKIFFIGSLDSSFINNDYKELQKHFKVKKCNIPPIISPKTWRTYQSMWEILWKVVWCDTVFSWFASWRAIIPTIFAKMLGKKIVIVAGGYDVVYAPEINYGAFARQPDKKISKFLFKYADIVLPVSGHIQKELLEKLTPKETKLVYNGVITDNFYPKGKKINNLVITVGEINWSNLKRKGIAHFVKAAKYLPDANFVVIGQFKDTAIDYLKRIASPNVSFTGYVDNEDLLRWYQAAKVYAQLSYHEGFGISVAEAMLCNCIPIVSNKGALPEVAGKWDTYYGKPKLAAECIKIAIEGNNTGSLFRDRILMNFSLEKRINKIKEILE